MTLPIQVRVKSAIVGLPLGSFAAQHHPEMPAGMTHEQHMRQMKKDAEMKQHGQMAMSFNQPPRHARLA